jgi:asparagine synthase (glutamine-hydrolysing)
MNNFFCALRTDGGQISRTELFAQIARLPRHLDWQSDFSGAFAAMAAGPRHSLRPLLARGRGYLALGDVRLDNRRDLARIAGVDDTSATDLEVVGAAMDRLGATVIPDILGDFSFVFWDARGQKLIAARDAFGVKPLYYRREGNYLFVASRLASLVGDETLDHEYLADLLIGLPTASPRTVWRGTHAVEGGALLVQRGSVTAQSRYWDPAAFSPARSVNEADAAVQFRDLFLRAVDQRTAGSDPIWAQLSGGLDSSAVVAAAQRRHLADGNGRLGGTVTIVDSLGDGDEQRFSDAVLAQYPVRNEIVKDYWPWRDEQGWGPPVTDEPTPLFPFHARDQAMVEAVRQHGSRILLSGLGSDHYLHGTMHYMADLLASGSVRSAMHEALGWAIANRRSFWSTAHYNALMPLLHLKGIGRSRTRLPRWMNRGFANAHAVEHRIAEAHMPHAQFGRLYVTHTATELRRVANWIQRGPFEDHLEMRYPFLHRPLVEFALRLPISMKIRPGTHKWILREALRGILPERVRTRTTKGGMDARIYWSLQHEAALINKLITDPVLGQLGCVNVDEVRKMVELARQGEFRHTVHLFSVLSLESWLRARFGMWPTRATAQTAA